MDADTYATTTPTSSTGAAGGAGRSGTCHRQPSDIAAIVRAAAAGDIAPGAARTGHGYTIPADLAKQWAGPEARTIAVLLSKTRQISAYSTTHRIFTEQQRLTLIARDHHCTFPGCTAGPHWCQVHHVTEYQHTGRTSVDDATLICGFHHRHFEAMGWTCEMTDGRPRWTPPHWLHPALVPH
jgi:hypothetical protein